jgi:histidine triad (HIT) family protein
MSKDCLFCRIAKGEIPADIVMQNDDAVAFRDISPRAPTHILVIPRKHVRSLEQADDSVDLGALMRTAADVARKEGLVDSGYRVVINTGSHGGQTVDHLHFHILGGRQMTWPPG